MKIAARKSGNRPGASARVVDGKLILSYPEALNPVVWQMDLVQAKASALEVREGSKGNFILALKTPKGETTEIAPFATKQDAVEALMAASGALENAHGQIRPLNVAATEIHVPAATPLPQKQGGKWAAALLGILMIVVLFGVWASLAPRPPVSIDGTRISPNPAANSGAQGNENGVPLSADEFLMQNRRQ